MSSLLRYKWDSWLEINLKFLRPRGDAAFPNCYSIKWFESASNNLELLPKATVRFSTWETQVDKKESGSLYVSPTQQFARVVYRQLSTIHISCECKNLSARIAWRSKNSPKKLYQMDDSKRGKETRITTLVLCVVWLRSMGDDTPECGVSDILCRWWVNRVI